MGDQILPIIDRRAPLLSKLRNSDSEESFRDMGERLGKEIGAISKMENEEQLDAAHQEIVEGMIRGIASSTGMEEDEVSFEFVEEMTDSIINGRDDILSEIESLNPDDIEDSEEE